MNTEQDLMQRLAVSKKIMEKHGQMSRSNSTLPSSTTVEEFQPVNATYNLPQEFLQEQEQPKNDFDPTQPLEESRILKSKLPDEIKQLMIEQPIVQSKVGVGSTDISEEVIQGAQRLMNLGSNKNSESPKQKSESPITNTNTNQNNNTNININEIKSMIRDVVRDTVRDVVREELKDAGMLAESTSDSNEVIQFKVGKHLFIGKVTKIKKLQ